MKTNDVLQLIETLKNTGYNHIDVSHEGSRILLSNADCPVGNTGGNGTGQRSAANGSGVVQGASAGGSGIVQGAVTNDSQASGGSKVESTGLNGGADSGTSTEVKTAVSAEMAGADKPGHIVESPIVGTFYGAASPDADDFVKVGSKVSKGDVLCIIEAMKLMNEIEADVDGEIAEIMVGNEDGVEFGQPLFRIV